MKKRKEKKSAISSGLDIPQLYSDVLKATSRVLWFPVASHRAGRIKLLDLGPVLTQRIRTRLVPVVNGVDLVKSWE